MPKEVENIPNREIRIGNSTGYVHDIFTNGIVYLDFVFDLEGLSNDDLMLLPFASDAITAIGLPGMPYDDVARELDLRAGGFGSQLEVSPVLNDPSKLRKFLFFRLKALEETLPEALELVNRLFREADFTDRNRVRDLLFEIRNDIKSSVIPRGHMYATLRALRNLSPSHAIDEMWRGITQLSYLSKIDPEKDAEKVGNACAELLGRVLTRDNVLLGITCSDTMTDRVSEQLSEFLRQLPEMPKASGASTNIGSVAGTRYEALIAPTSVGFVSTVFPSSRLGKPEYVHESLVAHYLQTGFLWERIRMRGGAYGAHAGAAALEGTFSFSSYRDPNILETLNAFRESLEFIARQKIPQEAVDQTIIGSVGHELRPLSPAEKGIIGLKRNLYGITDELRQNKRSLTIATKVDDLVKAADRLLSGFGNAYSAVLCNREALERAALKLPALNESVTEIPL